MALDSAQGDLNQAQAYLEAWYDSGMDRVSGWYKRSSQWVIFWIALFVTIALNINTITIADYLARNDVARAALVARAQAAVEDSAFINRNYSAITQELDTLGLPIGWSKGWGAPRQHYQPASGGLMVWNNVLAPLVGWLLTALAATLGAPFWFDVLNKVMVIRSTVKPHEKSPEEASEDRQRPSPPPPAPTGTGAPTGPAIRSFRVAAPASPPLEPLISTPRDEESNLDCCHVVAETLTSDEHLPAAEGGVA
jgi:hypothetical protein